MTGRARDGGSAFFDASNGSDPVIIQHIFWLFGHAETWLVLFVLVGILVAAACGALMLWRRSEAGYQAASLALMAFVVTLALLSVVGWVEANRAVDTALHDTYYVVASFHFIFMFCTGLLFLAAAYAVLTAMFGLAFRRWLVVLQIALFAAGVWIVAIASHVFTVQGMPRRYTEFSEVMQQMQFISMIGYFATLTSLLVFAMCIVEAVIRRQQEQKSDPPKP